MQRGTPLALKLLAGTVCAHSQRNCPHSQVPQNVACVRGPLPRRELAGLLDSRATWQSFRQLTPSAVHGDSFAGNSGLCWNLRELILAGRLDRPESRSASVRKRSLRGPTTPTQPGLPGFTLESLGSRQCRMTTQLGQRHGTCCTI